MNIVTNTFKKNLKQKNCTIIYSFFCILLFCEFLMYFFVLATYIFLFGIVLSIDNQYILQ